MIMMRNSHFRNLLLKIQLFTKLRNLTSNKMSQIKTFVFMDLETTGLPYLEHNLTKITEFCAVAVQADHIELGCFPRVHNKLSFCFNPRKTISPEVTDITGLSNDLLEHQGCFSSDVVEIINKWLNMNHKPICLVAHNGNRFDYPIFRAEIEKTGCLLEGVLCVDSLAAFRHIDSARVEEAPKEVPFEFDDGFDALLCQATDEYERDVERQRLNLSPEEVQKINETTPKKQMIGAREPPRRKRAGPSLTPKRNFGNGRQSVSYKLVDVYTRLTSKKPLDAHEAENDVLMLVTCAATYGEKFVAYANENSVKFSDVPAMKPGKRIGT